MDKKKYVVGIVLSEDLFKTLLICKNRPEWMAGKLNGVGGKVEPGELPVVAMAREMFEETSVMILAADWTHFLQKEFPDAIVDFFYTTCVLESARTMTDEKLGIVHIAGLHLLPNLMSNLRWIIPMAVYCASPVHRAGLSPINTRIIGPVRIEEEYIDTAAVSV